ncbi:SUN domain-containing ossification factor-like, partial [Saccoglossus kowalevskii]
MKTVPEETPPLPDVEKTFYAEKDAHELPLGEQSKSGVVLPTSKESIFMRLNNRIKDLEYNMSLSQQYLQELSQRYRKQMDEMQKNFNKTVGRLTDSSQIADEKDHKQQDTIENLETQLARLTKLVENVSLEMKDMQHQMIERHFFLMLVEVVSLSFLFLFCVTRQRRRVHDIAPNKPVITIDSHSKKKTKLKRRNSVDGSVGHKKLELGKLKKKHHDDENISITGDYSDLLIVKPTKSLSVVLKK